MHIKEKDKPQWWVLRTRPNAAKKAAAALDKMGIAHYLPLQVQVRQWHDRKRKVSVAILGTYLFVQLPVQERNRVFEVDCIQSYLSEEGKAVTVSAQEIERMEAICNYEHPITFEAMDKRQWQKGSKVRILSGHFTGWEGIMLEDARSSTVQIALEKIGMSAKLEIAQTALKLLASD